VYLASGACNCAGVVGVTLGAGIGYLQGTFGLVIDSLLSVNFITASGEKIEVSESSNADLFWALRGAGANFGIVTSATYQLSERVNDGQVFHAELLFSASQQEDYFKMMESYQDQMPSALGFSSTLFWNATTNSVSVESARIFISVTDNAKGGHLVHIHLRGYRGHGS
jgi:fumiquinazoline A oxidase